jgi:hypothetical protein
VTEYLTIERRRLTRALCFTFVSGLCFGASIVLAIVLLLR